MIVRYHSGERRGVGKIPILGKLNAIRSSAYVSSRVWKNLTPDGKRACREIAKTMNLRRKADRVIIVVTEPIFICFQYAQCTLLTLGRNFGKIALEKKLADYTVSCIPVDGVLSARRY